MRGLTASTAVAGMAMLFAAPAGMAEITFGGVVEVEVSAIDSDANEDTSDIAVPTVELDAVAQLSEAVEASVVFLAEDVGTDDQTSVEIDEAYIAMALGKGWLTVGQTYLPFGVYESGAISDPLTLTLGETAETVVMFSLENESGFEFAAYMFNGAVDGDGGEDDEINDAGLSVSLNRDDWSLGVDLISNIGDSDTLGDLANPAEDDDVAGLAVHGSYLLGWMSIIAEHVMAMDEFDVGDAAGLKPSATQIEISLALGDDSALIAGYSSADDGEGLVDYEKQWLLAYSTLLMEQLGMTLEFVSAEEFSGDKDSGFTLQLAAEF